MLTINLEFDANAAAAPQSFRNGVQAAANELETTITTPITANIVVGYGEYGLGTAAYMPLVSNFSVGGINSVVRVGYPALRAALIATDTYPGAVQAVNALPNTSSLNGQSTFPIAPALAKALGFAPANATTVDGEIGFPTSFTGVGLIGTAVVEELHALGLLNSGGDLGLFSYTSLGVHFLPSGATSASPAYFSLDGGKTDLADYATGADDTLFSGLPNDPLNFPFEASGNAFTALDLSEIGAVGFNINTPAPVQATTPTPASAGGPDPGTIAINAAAVYGFANTGAPSFTAAVNQDGNADLALGSGAVTGAFIGGFVAGIEIRVMANLEQSGGVTAPIDAQFTHDLDSLAGLLATPSVAAGFGFLSGLTVGGPTGLTGGSTPAGLTAEIRGALGTDQQAAGALGSCVIGAVNFTQGYIDAINAGRSPLDALHSVEASALT